MKKILFVCAVMALPMGVSAQLKMNSVGNIGIGTTSPSSRLEVNNGDLTLKAGPSTSTDPGDLILTSSTGTEYGRIFCFPQAMRFRANSTSGGDLNINNSNGYVGIKTLTALYPLDVAGSVRSTGSYIGSDKRYKDNILQIDAPRYQNLYALNGYTYDLKDPSNFNTETNDSTKATFSNKTTQSMGVIAQEVREYFPELVSEDERGFLSVNYDGLIPVMIEALKEQNIRIEELQKQFELIDQGSMNTSTSFGYLKQNNPNPFDEKTDISYEINSDFQTASINVYDLSGKLITSKRLESKTGVITILGSELYKGLFIYNLVVNGSEVASKKLIVQ